MRRTGCPPGERAGCSRRGAARSAPLRRPRRPARRRARLRTVGDGRDAHLPRHPRWRRRGGAALDVAGWRRADRARGRSAAGGPRTGRGRAPRDRPRSPTRVRHPMGRWTFGRVGGAPPCGDGGGAGRRRRHPRSAPRGGGGARPPRRSPHPARLGRPRPLRPRAWRRWSRCAGGSIRRRRRPRDAAQRAGHPPRPRAHPDGSAGTTRPPPERAVAARASGARPGRSGLPRRPGPPPHDARAGHLAPHAGRWGGPRSAESPGGGAQARRSPRPDAGRATDGRATAGRGSWGSAARGAPGPRSRGGCGVRHRPRVVVAMARREARCSARALVRVPTRERDRRRRCPGGRRVGRTCGHVGAGPQAAAPTAGVRGRRERRPEIRRPRWPRPAPRLAGAGARPRWRTRGTPTRAPHRPS